MRRRMQEIQHAVNTYLTDNFSDVPIWYSGVNLDVAQISTWIRLFVLDNGFSPQRRQKRNGQELRSDGYTNITILIHVFHKFENDLIKTQRIADKLIALLDQQDIPFGEDGCMRCGEVQYAYNANFAPTNDKLVDTLESASIRVDATVF